MTISATRGLINTCTQLLICLSTCVFLLFSCRPVLYYHHTSTHHCDGNFTCFCPDIVSIQPVSPFPSPSFLSLAVQLRGRGPGTFPHMSDITCRKRVERLQLNVGKHDKVLCCLLQALCSAYISTQSTYCTMSNHSTQKDQTTAQCFQVTDTANRWSITGIIISSLDPRPSSPAFCFSVCDQYIHGSRIVAKNRYHCLDLLNSLSSQQSCKGREKIAFVMTFGSEQSCSSVCCE